jgi:hypothetical protein
LVGTTADFWVQHEASLSEKTHSIIDIANKVPLLRFITPLICAIATPLVKAVSDWLVERSQSVEKSIQYQQDAASRHEKPAAIEWEGGTTGKPSESEDSARKEDEKVMYLGNGVAKGKQEMKEHEEAMSPAEEKKMETDSHQLDVGVHDDKGTDRFWMAFGISYSSFSEGYGFEPKQINECKIYKTEMGLKHRKVQLRVYSKYGKQDIFGD